MEIKIKPDDKTYKFLLKNDDRTVEILQGENILYGFIKSISSTGNYIVEIMEKQDV